MSLEDAPRSTCLVNSCPTIIAPTNMGWVRIDQPLKLNYVTMFGYGNRYSSTRIVLSSQFLFFSSFIVLVVGLLRNPVGSTRHAKRIRSKRLIAAQIVHWCALSSFSSEGSVRTAFEKRRLFFMFECGIPLNDSCFCRIRSGYRR